MSETLGCGGREAGAHSKPSQPVNIFQDWWLQSFGYALAALYLTYFVILYRAGSWIVDGAGRPIYTDFACAWTAAIQATSGDAASLYDAAQFVQIQAAVVGHSDYIYPNWPYPPTFLLILAPLAALGYSQAFIAWDLLTLLGCIAIVYLIVRRRTAIALVLATPFSAWNFLAAHTGFLTAGFVGASLLLLERRPVLAGVFLGLLTYKPQFGILFPVALLAVREWRAIAGCAITLVLLAVAALAAFGPDVWIAFPRELVAQAGLNFPADPDSNWAYLQTAYGLIRSLRGGANLAWLVQGLITLCTAIIVWLIWRSLISYELKAAILSAGALLATPYAFAYDMAAIVVPAAFLAKDQLNRGLLRGEKAMWIVLFGAPLAALVTLGDNIGGPTFGGTPVSLFSAALLFLVILRRVLRYSDEQEITHDRPGLLPAAPAMTGRARDQMNETARAVAAAAGPDRVAPRIVGVFAQWRLLAYGYTFPVFYGAFFFYLYYRGLWLAHENGDPVYHDFTWFWVAGWQALHGETTTLYGQEAFREVLDNSAALGRSPNGILPYPPTFTLVVAALAMLPYFAAFLTWESVTLACCITVVYLIVRRQPAISLMLASPFAAWNFLIGQNGFLSTALIGASLLFLQQQPVLAGVFIGCLTYKPQLGILFPVALVATRQWRAFASAAMTAIFLVAASMAAFGLDGWIAFPRALLSQGTGTMFASPDWGFLLQTVYGLMLVLHGSSAAAWLVQGLVTVATAVIVWLVWRSSLRYSLKAATLSAAALIATPYGFAYDLAAIAIPVAFLATDQIRYGVLRGEQTTLIALFVAGLPVIPTTGKAPVGAVIAAVLLCLILRRVASAREIGLI